MASVLVLLNDPERGAMDLEGRLAGRFPSVRVQSSDIASADQSVLARAEVIVTLGAHLGSMAPEIFAGASSLKWVQLIGAGTDNVVEHLPSEERVAVTSVRGVHGRQMSEAALGVMLALARDLPGMLARQARREWTRSPPRLLCGKTVGILGMGLIGADLAATLKALGMRVVGLTSSARAVDGVHESRPRSDLPDAVADLDYLVVLAPHTPHNHHVVGAAMLAAMKPSACLVNLARGGVVDEEAVIEALESGRLAGAALDVFETEPLPVSSPLWAMDRVIVTPHLGGFHEGYADQVVEVVESNLAKFLAGGVEALPRLQ